MDELVLYIIIALVAGILLGYLLRNVLYSSKLDAERRKVEAIASDAQKEAERLIGMPIYK